MEMFEQYVCPQLEVISISVSDVIAISFGNGGEGMSFVYEDDESF